jgi:hypothetical protein
MVVFYAAIKSVSLSLAFARMPRVAAWGGMATGDRGVARRAKTGGFGAVPLGFATDAPRGSAGSFTCQELSRRVLSSFPIFMMEAFDSFQEGSEREEVRR